MLLGLFELLLQLVALRGGVAQFALGDGRLARPLAHVVVQFGVLLLKRLQRRLVLLEGGQLGRQRIVRCLQLLVDLQKKTKRIAREKSSKIK